MVAGDLVNTASRIQSAAEPGTVLVGEATRRATEAAIAYEDAGAHELKGKAEPVPLCRALRVVAGARRRAASRTGSSRRSSAATASSASSRSSSTPPPRSARRTSSRSSASPASASRGSPGSSRSTSTAWPTIVWWHRGRCLAYGEGVAYWALAEMVRMRAGIAEDEEPATAPREAPSRRSTSTSPTPRSAPGSSRASRTCSGSTSGVAGDREDLFAAWRLFFERLAERRARSSSSSRTCSGPTRRCSTSSSTCSTGRATTRSSCSRWPGPSSPSGAPTWGAGEPELRRTLVARAAARRRRWRSCSTGSCRACPTSCARRSSSAPRACRSTRSRPCGCCSTAACSSREGDVYRPTGRDRGARGARDAARAHRRAARRARRRRSAGCSRTPRCSARRSRKHGLAALSGSPEDELEPLLASLVRKEVLSRPGRPALARARPVRLPPGPAASRSPTRRCRSSERKSAPPRRGGAPHRAFGAAEQEIVEVVAAHYSRRATRLRRTPTDAAEIKAQARETLAQARPSAPPRWRATEEAQRYFEQAAELPTTAAARRRCSSAPADGLGVRGRGEPRRACTSSERSPLLRGAGATAAGGAGLGPARERSTWRRPARPGPRAHGALLRGRSPKTSRDEDLATLAASSGACSSSSRRARGGAASRSRPRSRSPRRSAAARCRPGAERPRPLVARQGPCEGDAAPRGTTASRWTGAPRTLVARAPTTSRSCPAPTASPRRSRSRRRSRRRRGCAATATARGGALRRARLARRVDAGTRCSSGSTRPTSARPAGRAHGDVALAIALARGETQRAAALLVAGWQSADRQRAPFSHAARLTCCAAEGGSRRPSQAPGGASRRALHGARSAFQVGAVRRGGRGSFGLDDLDEVEGCSRRRRRSTRRADPVAARAHEPPQRRSAAARANTASRGAAQAAAALFADTALIFDVAVTQFEHAEWLTEQGRPTRRRPCSTRRGRRSSGWRRRLGWKKERHRQV